MSKTITGPGGSRSMRILLVALLALAPLGSVSAATATISRAFPTSFRHSLTGVCFADGGMHAVGKGNVLIAYDATSGAMAEVADPMIPGLMHSHIHSIAADDQDGYWVGEVHSRQLFRLRFADHTVSAVLPFPVNPTPVFGITYARDLLWVGYHSGGPSMPIHGIDPQSGEVVEVIDFGSTDVHGLAWVGDFLWVLDNLQNTLLQVDVNGEVRQGFQLPVDTWASLAFDGERLWTSNLNWFFRFDIPPQALCPQPGEVGGLVFSNPDRLNWSEPTALGGSPVTYDVLRADMPSEFDLQASCVASSGPTVTDAEVPESGSVFHYLVRARNLCPLGPGTLGTDSNGDERWATVCF